MGTEYRVANLTRKEMYGFGLDWRPKYAESMLNWQPSAFLLFLAMDARRGDHLVLINDGNAWDWYGHNGFDHDEWTDATEEMEERFQEWLAEEPDAWWNRKLTAESGKEEGG